MPTPPQSQLWPADRALLLVHGVGDAKPGDYDSLVQQLRTVFAAQKKEYAIYFLYYDQVNQWFATKTQAALAVASLISTIRAKVDATKLGNTVADFAGDIIWPILIADAREAVRTTLLQQIQQIVRDGRDSGYQPRDQHLSIITHSLGCFHVFEALHSAANDPRLGIAPGTNRVRFDNVVFMASPVQLIRSAAQSLGGTVPQRDALQTASLPALVMPSEKIATGQVVPSVARTVSITGNLDPVGGYLFRKQLPWAYMALPGQEAFIDPQQALNVTDEASLEAVLAAALRDHAAPDITLQNPHSWGAYVDRHATELNEWFDV
jgi:hypothetical protein